MTLYGADMKWKKVDSRLLEQFQHLETLYKDVYNFQWLTEATYGIVVQV